MRTPERKQKFQGFQVCKASWLGMSDVAQFYIDRLSVVTFQYSFRHVFTDPKRLRIIWQQDALLTHKKAMKILNRYKTFARTVFILRGWTNLVLFYGLNSKINLRIVVEDVTLSIQFLFRQYETTPKFKSTQLNAVFFHIRTIFHLI